jgi:hypothetical protein
MTSSFNMINTTEQPPSDDEVTRILYLDNQQIEWGNNSKGLRWAVNARLYNETIPKYPILLKMYETGGLIGPNCECV